MKTTLKVTVLAMIIAVAAMLASMTAVFAEPDETVPTPITASAGTQATNTLATSANGVNGAGITYSPGVSVKTVIILLILTLIINAVISFFISNRFYKMSKRDGHLQSEIRALRRDIDDKFSSRITELNERSVSVKNNNPSYARADDAITYKEEPSDAVSEIAKRWNIQISDESETAVRKNNPERGADSAEIRRERSTDGTEMRARRDSRASKHRTKKSGQSKTKKLLSDIFPFEED